MARPPFTPEERNRIFEKLIMATYYILEAFGPGQTTVRKVAEQAGCKTSTIYNYFEDSEHLAMYASMKYLSDYNAKLARHVSSITDPLERFYSIWSFFDEAAFEHPEGFNRLFYGKHRDKLAEVIRTYYEVFPDELEGVDDEAQEMLKMGSLLERNRFLVVPLVEAGIVEEENADLVNEIASSSFQTLLEERIFRGPGYDSEYACKRIMEIIRFAVEKG